ncbi:MAG: ATP-binding cassette domain-containing protein [Ruminococcaceae bacterium]|nr:ATP-binding cassette domain-containing protein [Oscillospiraceae bacterium]
MKLRNVYKSYGNIAVLKNLSLDFAPGGRYQIGGPSGCGKTTLLRLLMGLERPDAGEIEAKERIAAVFQENRLCPWLTAEENIRLVAPKARAADCLAALGLPLDQRPVSEYSGGMQRRVALARALLAESEVLLLDEPFTGLDEENRDRAIAAIDRWAGERTILFVSHESSLPGAEKVEM